MRILCYGDSNTWGFIPNGNYARYDETKRYTKILEKLLEDCTVIEKGLSGRTLMTENKEEGKEWKMGFNYLRPCIETHNPFDYMVLMLGTNEFKKAYPYTAKDILNFMETYIRFLTNYKFADGNSLPKLIISGSIFCLKFAIKSINSFFILELSNPSAMSGVFSFLVRLIAF